MLILEGKKIKGKISYCFKGECYHSTQSCIKKERENNLHLRRIYHFVGVGRGGSMREEKMHDPHGGCKTYLPLAPAPSPYAPGPCPHGLHQQPPPPEDGCPGRGDVYSCRVPWLGYIPLLKVTACVLQGL